MKLHTFMACFALLTGCTFNHSINFTPSQEYAISVRAELFDTVRIIDNNDITLFRNDKALGFMRVETLPPDIASSPAPIETLRSASKVGSVPIRNINTPEGYQGFSAQVGDHLTGYVLKKANPQTVLIVSFPEELFEDVINTISAGI
ncbi:MAG: hypothetical protein SVX28_08890 [Pseudomonadota bacterium]|nr:hypothetical protein [Pseudomonadota bacterium]